MNLKYRGVAYQPAVAVPGVAPSQKGIYRGVPFVTQRQSLPPDQPSNVLVYRGVQYIA
jgi:hypothetical protein